jgi:hypothetical protein
MSKAFIVVFAMIVSIANVLSMSWTQNSRSVIGANTTINGARTVTSITNSQQKNCLASAASPVGLRPPYVGALAKHLPSR